MSDAHDLGPVPQRVTLAPEQVHRLVADQFPQWADLPVRPVASGGWDNQTFHLGDALSVRLPSAAEYEPAVDKEHTWLPRLAPQLPLPIPTLVGRGRPGHGYPFAWSVLRWLDGVPVRAELIAEPARFARELADFLLALRAIDPTDGPPPGLHNWYRGGSLRTFEDLLERSLVTAGELVDAARAHEVWAAALAARWDGVPVWFHGDVAEGNLLLTDGQLAAVIDFGTCGVGDPACDLAAAWTLLDDDGRRAFRERLGVDDAAWARGRGWALWKTLAILAEAVSDGEPTDRPAGVLAQILAP